MNKDQARTIIIEELSNIAPEVNFETIGADEDLMEALDIDSLDFLNFVSALHKKTGVNVPETDYRKLLTLDGAAAYLAGKAA